MNLYPDFRIKSSYIPEAQTEYPACGTKQDCKNGNGSEISLGTYAITVPKTQFDICIQYDMPDGFLKVYA